MAAGKCRGLKTVWVDIKESSALFMKFMSVKRGIISCKAWRELVWHTVTKKNERKESEEDTER